MKGRGLYKIRTVARLTGFSPSVLRAWQARHSLLVPERSVGGQRLYTEDDLRVLRRVGELLAAGQSIGEIARIGRRALLQAASSMSPRQAGVTQGPGSVRLAEQLERWRETVVRGAVELSSAGIEQALDEAFASVAPEVVLDEVVQGAARQVGDLWSRGECSIAGEHLATAVLTRRLHRLIEARRPHREDAPVVLCACLPDEQHALGLLMVASYLVTRNLRVLELGAALPLADLEAACNACAPTTVCLSVSREAILAAHEGPLVALVRRWTGRSHFILGGGGARPGLRGFLAAGGEIWPPGRSLRELEVRFRAR